MIPIFLEDYDMFRSLKKWGEKNREDQRRHWSISMHSGTMYRCNLSWRFGESQLGGIDKVAMSPQECVYLALEEFSEWEKSYGG